MIVKIHTTSLNQKFNHALKTIRQLAASTQNYNTILRILDKQLITFQNILSQNREKNHLEV